MGCNEDLVEAALCGDVAAARAALDGGANILCSLEATVRCDVWLFACALVSAPYTPRAKENVARRWALTLRRVACSAGRF